MLPLWRGGGSYFEKFRADTIQRILTYLTHQERRVRELEAYWVAQRNTASQRNKLLIKTADYRRPVRNTCWYTHRQGKYPQSTSKLYLGYMLFWLEQIWESQPLTKNKADQRGSKTFKMINRIKILSARWGLFPSFKAESQVGTHTYNMCFLLPTRSEVCWTASF